MAGGGGTRRAWRPRKADIVFVGGLVGLIVEFVTHHDSPNPIWLAIFTPAVGLAPYVRAVEAVRAQTSRSSPTSPDGPDSLPASSGSSGGDRR